MRFQIVATPDPVQGVKPSGSTSKVKPRQLKQAGKTNIVKQHGIHWVGCYEDLNDTPYPDPLQPGSMIYPIPRIVHRFRADKAFYNRSIFDPELTDGFTHSLLDVEILYGCRVDNVCAFPEGYDSGCLTAWCVYEEGGEETGIWQSPWKLTPEDVQAIIACIPDRLKPEIGLRACNIQWDADDQDCAKDLPGSLLVPRGMTDEDEISDYLTKETGFCHKGFRLAEVYLRKESAGETV